MSFKDKADSLIHKIITKIELSENDTKLKFILSDGHMEFEAQGDCCSESWIEHFDQITMPSIINEFKQVPIPSTFDITPTKKDYDEESMEYYFYELVTDKGSYMIEMRNSSNGYYGGYLK